jgi:GTPase SAR1 family protein
MGSNQSTTSAGPNKQTRRYISDLKFRVLVLGRANAGKTTILQRVCETTESPKIYRGGEEVRHCGSNFYSDV